MAKKSMIIKQQRPAKFSSRQYNRCKLCGRPHAYLRNYGVCRVCFRELAYKGQIPGVKKASWSFRAVYLRTAQVRQSDVRSQRNTGLGLESRCGMPSAAGPQSFQLTFR